jgi:hypothetical protein
MSVPVVFLIYNRPEVTGRAFAAIRAQRPRTLIVVADGPRDDADARLCATTRSIVDLIDWPCNLQTDFAARNLGCASRIASGITAVLEKHEAAIFIEDDCVVDGSFFPFSEELLERYATDERMGAITAANFRFARPASESYSFSRYPIPWGWGTWSRAWRHYDRDMVAWPELKSARWLLEVFQGDAKAASYWEAAFDRAHRKEIDTWDYAWFFACWRNGMLSAVPSQNLVSNIGFSRAATHTSRRASALAEVPAVPMVFPLVHPHDIKRDTRADRLVQKSVFERQSRLWLRRGFSAMRDRFTGGRK